MNVCFKGVGVLVILVYSLGIGIQSSAGEKAWLYYSNMQEIRRIRADARFPEIVVEKTQESIALDFDYDANLLFWSEVGTITIKSATIGKQLATNIKTVIHSNASRIDGLAVDWLYKHVYWTDTDTDTIKVTNYDGNLVKTLVDTGLDEPRAICLDPENGYMYWSDWGDEPKIERCGMDGSDRMTLVEESDGLLWPIGLTIDYVGRRMYWIDAKFTRIASAKLDGTDISNVHVAGIRAPFSISVFEDTLYWTDSVTYSGNSIMSANKMYGNDTKTFPVGSSATDIKLYHEQKQEIGFKLTATNMCATAKCEELCLPRPKTGANTSVACACSNGKTLLVDQRHCIVPGITPSVNVRVPKSTAQVPSAPLNLKVEFVEVEPPIIRVSWQKPEESHGEIVHYKLYWGPKGQVYHEEIIRPERMASYTPPLEEGILYEFRVTAKNGINYGAEAVAEKETPEAEAWLYFATTESIFRIRANGSNSMEFVVENTQKSIALDIDYDADLVFWSSADTKTINSATTENVSWKKIKTVIQSGATQTDGLAVDWLYKHVYWTDTATDTIKVTNYDGNLVKTLVNTGLDEPRAICLDPENGYMYWSDWGQGPKIERSGMDGSGRDTLVDKNDGLQWPNGLTIDYIGKRIYWIDAKLHLIGTAKLDGTDKSNVLVDATVIQVPFAISVFENTLYWSDWRTNSIKSVNKVSGNNTKTIVQARSIMDIKVCHNQRQDTGFKQTAKNMCAAAQCEDFCLPRPKAGATTSVVCACSNGKTLSVDQRCLNVPTPQVTIKTTTESAEVPEQPTNLNLVADVVSPTEIQLRWDEPIDVNEMTSYMLFYNSSRQLKTEQLQLDKMLTGFKFNDLIPDTVYNIQLSLKNRKGEDLKCQLIQARTLDFIPAAPTHVEFSTINSTALSVKWRPDQQQGVIRGYYIYYVKLDKNGDAIFKTEKSIDVDVFHINGSVIGGLKPETLYSVSVSAYTRKGEGVRSTPKHVTTEAVPKRLEVQQIGRRDALVRLKSSAEYNKTTTPTVYVYDSMDNTEPAFEVKVKGGVGMLNDLHPSTEYFLLLKFDEMVDRRLSANLAECSFTLQSRASTALLLNDAIGEVYEARGQINTTKGAGPNFTAIDKTNDNIILNLSSFHRVAVSSYTTAPCPQKKCGMLKLFSYKLSGAMKLQMSLMFADDMDFDWAMAHL